MKVLEFMIGDQVSAAERLEDTAGLAQSQGMRHLAGLCRESASDCRQMAARLRVNKDAQDETPDAESS